MAPLNVPFTAQDDEDIYAHLNDEDWALQSRIDKRFTASLTVEQRAEGSHVYYDIFSGDSEEILIKETRLAELELLDRAIHKEVPDFEGNLPWNNDGKELYQRVQRSQAQKTSFDESRRAGIELYMRMIATKQAAIGSDALRSFFMISRLAEPNAPLVRKKLVLARYQSGKKARKVRTSILAGFDLELAQEMNARREALDEAIVVKSRLERSLKQGEQAAGLASQQLQAKIDVETSCAESLDAHCANLNEFPTLLEAKKAFWKERHAGQETALARLKTELESASPNTEAARKRFDALKEKSVEMDTAARSRIQEADDAVNAAVVASAVAVQRKAAISVALSAMQDAITSHERNVKEAEFDKNMKREAANSLKQQHKQALFSLSSDKEKADAANAAVASNAASTEKSHRKLDTEIRRAKELSSTAAKLRDLQSRKKVLGKARQALEKTEPGLFTGADKASQLFITLTDKMVKQKSADSERRRALELKVDQATRELENREKAAADFAARVEHAEKEAFDKAGLYEAAKEALAAVCQEHEAMKARVEGPLTDEVNQAKEAERKAKENAAAQRRKAEEEASTQHNAQEAEQKVLTQLEQAEAQLERARDVTSVNSQEALDELDHLEGHHQEPVPPIQLEKVVKIELGIVAEHLKKHRAEEQILVDKLKVRDAEWVEQKESLRTQLHEATLQESLAKEAVLAASNLKEATVGDVPSQPKTEPDKKEPEKKEE